MGAYTVFSSQVVSHDALGRFLVPYNPHPAYDPLGGLQEGWAALTITDEVELFIYPESPYGPPRSIRDAAAQILGAPVAGALGLMWTTDPVPFISLAESERAEREGRWLVERANSLVWSVVTAFGDQYPTVFWDCTTRPLVPLGRLSSSPPQPPWASQSRNQESRRGGWLDRMIRRFNS